MKIEIGFVEGEEGALESPEPFLSAGQFFLVADILGQLARNTFDDRGEEAAGEDTGEPTGPLGPGAAAFLQFISARLDDSEREFEAYCKFVAEADQQLAAQRGAGSGALGAAPASPGPEDFDPRARAFLGRLILSEPEIGPEIARVLLPAAQWVQEALEPSLVALVDKDPDAAAQVQFVSNVFGGLAVFCEESIAESRAFGFAF